MSAVQDVLEKVKLELIKVFEKIQETSLYQNLHSKFYSLSPNYQKTIITITVVFISFFILSIPFSTFFASSDQVVDFESKRDLLKDLYRAKNESQVQLPFSQPPSASELKSRLDTDLKNSQLTNEQIMGVELDQIPEQLPKDQFEGALNVRLGKLNVRQIVDLGHMIQSISAGIKMIDLSIIANPQEPKYYDVIYKFVILKVPNLTPDPVSDEPTKGNKAGKRGSTKSNSNDKVRDG